MKVAKGILLAIFIVALCSAWYSNTLRQGWYQFYKTGLWGLCTVPTIVPYTTNIVDAIEFTQIVQTQYYTAEVFGKCPTTTIYKADFDETVTD